MRSNIIWKQKYLLYYKAKSLDKFLNNTHVRVVGSAQ